MSYHIASPADDNCPIKKQHMKEIQFNVQQHSLYLFLYILQPLMVGKKGKEYNRPIDETRNSEKK